MFSIEQLRGFVAVAEHLHYGKAAEELRMTQPPLSRQIQKLEKGLGAMLLLRTNRQVELTSAGEVFLKRAKHILALVDNAPAIVQSVASGDEGQLNIGFTANASLSILGTALEIAREKLPGVKLSLTESFSNVQVLEILRSNLDLGFVRAFPTHENLGSLLVLKERLLLAVPEGHRLAVPGKIKPSDLAGEDFISYSPTDAWYFREKTDRLLAGVQVQSVFQVAQIHSMLQLVASGFGLAFVPESVQKRPVSGLYLREINPSGFGADTIDVELFAVWLKTSINPALNRMLHLLKDLS